MSEYDLPSPVPAEATKRARVWSVASVSVTSIVATVLFGSAIYTSQALGAQGNTSDEADSRKEYVCLPNDDGEGWDCRSGAEAASMESRLRQSRDARRSGGAVRTQPAQELPTADTSEVDALADESNATQQVNTPSQLAQPAQSDLADRNTTVKSTTVDDKPVSAPAKMKALVDEDSLLSWGRVPGSEATTPQIAVVDPDTLYVPTSPRAPLPSHNLEQDLARSLQVAQADDRSGSCKSGYSVRPLKYPRTADNAQFPILAEADSLSHEIDGDATLTGNVTVEQGNRVIVAPQVTLNQSTRVADFSQGVRMEQPGLVMQGTSATLQMNTKEADVADAQFVLTDVNMRGTAASLNQSAQGSLTLSDPSFTRCEPDNNGWELTTDSLVIEDGEVFGTARGAVLKLKSVPVFYTPYLKFPVSDERVSGFLFPNISYSDEDGVDVSIPYYFNLAPNYDATLIPRYVAERGAGAELEFRHKSSWADTVLSGAFLPEDDLYNGTLDRDDFDDLGGVATFGEFEPADRWLGGINHEGNIGRVRTFVDYAAVSDRDYFRDLGSDLAVSSRIELQRKAEVQYNHGGLFMRVWAQRFQRLDEAARNEYERLPELEMLYARDVGPFELSLGAKWADFDRDTDGLVGLEAVTGTRTHVEPRIRLPFSWPFGFLSVGAGYRYTSYDLEQDPNAPGFNLVNENPDRNIGTANLDGGLIFERDLEWFDTPLVQTLEPRVYYLWQEFADQDELPKFDASRLTFGYSQLFRGNRFSGLDRISDANQLSAGITTRFLGRTTGEEYFRASIGEIYYFEDRRVTLSGNPGANEDQSSSAIASEVAARLAKNWRIRGTLVWDPHDNEVDEGAAGLQYRRDNRHIVNIGFRNRRDLDIEQTDLSLYWPISDRFSIMGRWNYDLVSGRTIEGFGGLEYSDCCLQVRLLARRFLDAPTARQLATIEADDGIFLQIVFKGLAGFGTKVESVLERGISGYRSPEPRSYFSN